MNMNRRILVTFLINSSSERTHKNLHNWMIRYPIFLPLFLEKERIVTYSDMVDETSLDIIK